ncbi:unnamed protein product [Rhizophagus irregularis]|nr:unnamed protein product [Rhizophagus irregularis]
MIMTFLLTSAKACWAFNLRWFVMHLLSRIFFAFIYISSQEICLKCQLFQYLACLLFGKKGNKFWDSNTTTIYVRRFGLISNIKKSRKKK